MLNFPLTRRAFVAGTAATALALAGCSVEQPIEPGPAPADPADDNAPTEPVAAQSGVARTLTAAVAYEGRDVYKRQSQGRALALARTNIRSGSAVNKIP